MNPTIFAITVWWVCLHTFYILLMCVCLFMYYILHICWKSSSDIFGSFIKLFWNKCNIWNGLQSLGFIQTTLYLKSVWINLDENDVNMPNVGSAEWLTPKYSSTVHWADCRALVFIHIKLNMVSSWNLICNPSLMDAQKQLQLKVFILAVNWFKYLIMFNFVILSFLI